eukprot:27086-Eustigmatos_ZCMA.PRE.1
MAERAMLCLQTIAAHYRIHRRGQESSVQFIYLVEPPGSLEDDMWQSMSRLLSENTAVINSRE